MGIASSLGETDTSHNLAGGHLAPRWFCFLYYLYCRRQQEAPGAQWFRLRDPAFLAWNGLGAMAAMPWLALLLLIDHYLPFLHPLGRLWVALHLPGSPQHAWGYALIAVGLISGLGLFSVLFAGKHKRIMNAFSAYDSSPHTVIAGLPLLLACISMMGVAALGMVANIKGYPSALLIANLLVWSIFIATEIVFRTWWRQWCRHHASAPS